MRTELTKVTTDGQESKIVYATKTKAVKGSCIQGKNANYAGVKLENFVEDSLVEKGAFPVLYSKWANDIVTIPNWVNKVLYKQVAYTKLWGTEGRSDFVLESTKLGTIRIEVRSQGVAGSVEEKTPYLFQTCRDCYPEKHVIIVLDGAGIKPAVREWLVAQAAAVKHKKIEVMNKVQFAAWVNANV